MLHQPALIQLSHRFTTAWRPAAWKCACLNPFVVSEMFVSQLWTILRDRHSQPQTGISSALLLAKRRRAQRRSLMCATQTTPPFWQLKPAPERGACANATLDSRDAGLCCYLVMYLENLLHPWRMVSSGLLRRVALVRTDVSEEPGASFIRVTKIGELGTTLAAASNRRMLRRNCISPILVTLMKKALSSSETSVLRRATRRNIPESAILHTHRRENLKSYTKNLVSHWTTAVLVTSSRWFIASHIHVPWRWRRNVGRLLPDYTARCPTM
jgi:hypothetical protein